MQALLKLPGEETLDCLSCSFVRQKEFVVAAYSDGRAVVWDLTNIAEVSSSLYQCRNDKNVEIQSFCHNNLCWGSIAQKGECTQKFSQQEKQPHT